MLGGDDLARATRLGVNANRADTNGGYAIVDPALPTRTPEQQKFWEQDVELVFFIGRGADRVRRIVTLRNVSDEFANRSMIWLKSAAWRVRRTAARGCELEIHLTDRPCPPGDPRQGAGAPLSGCRASAAIISKQR